MESGFLDFVDTKVLDQYEGIQAITKAVGEHPAVAKWVADHS